jgi:hypothetical protein
LIAKDGRSGTGLLGFLCGGGGEAAASAAVISVEDILFCRLVAF